MQPIKIFTIKRAISKIKHIGEDKIVVVDESNSVRIFDLHELKLTGGFKINLPENRIFANNVDISNQGNYLALTIAKKNKVAIWDIPNKKLIHSVGWHKGEIESVAFDNERYLATGGTDGRTHLWNLETGKMVGNLAPHSDYVTSIAFSPNSSWCATAGYDKTISITNISSMQFIHKMRIHSSVILKLKFLKNFRLISGDKDGNIVISDYSKGKVIKRVPKLPDMVVDIAIDQDEKYMFATTKNNNLFLYDLETYNLITSQYIKTTSTITSLEFVSNLMYLIIGTIDGVLYIYDILSDEKTLENLIKNKNYEKAYELINENPLLKNSISYNHLEELWQKTITKAQLLLEKGQKEQAEEILKPFLSVSSKRMFIQSLFKDFLEFEKFKTLVLKKKYPLAYSLANQYPTFKQTAYYKHMEKEFKKTFTMARQLIFDRTKEEYTRKLLAPFRGVSEKTSLIQSLYNEKEIYKILKQKLAKKDFKGFFELVNRNPFLTDLDEYEKALDFAKRLYEAAESELNHGNYHKVLQYTHILENFPMYKEEAKKLTEKANVLANFMKLIANKEYEKVYEYTKQYHFLEDIDLFINLEKTWNKKISEAEKWSAKGKVNHILESLKHYMKIKEKLPKIGELIKSAYLYQIVSHFKKVDDKHLENAFKNYIRIFGIDSEIADLIELAQKQKRNINLNNIEEGNKNYWYKQQLPNNIFE